MMGNFGRTEPGGSQGMLDSPFTSGSNSRKAVSLPHFTEQVPQGHIPQLPNKENTSLTTAMHGA